MYSEIIDRNFNIFFFEIHLKKENLKSVFWAPKPVYQCLKKFEYVTVSMYVSVPSIVLWLFLGMVAKVYLIQSKTVFLQRP